MRKQTSVDSDSAATSRREKKAIAAKNKLKFFQSLTYESGGVVVTDGLGVTVGLKRRIGLDNLLLERTGVRALGSLGLGGLMKENEEKKKMSQRKQNKKKDNNFAINR